MLYFFLADAAAQNPAGDVFALQKQLLHYFEHVMPHASGAGQRWVIFGILILLSIGAAFICDWIIRKVLKKLASKTENTYDDRIIDAAQFPLVLALSLSGVYFSTALLHLSDGAALWVNRIYLVLVTALIMKLLLQSIGIAGEALLALAKKSGNVYHALLVDLIAPVCKTVVWICAILFILDNVFKFNISSLLAGAGIAAMAVAFAAQNTIANIFGAVALIVDRPFLLGQRIQVDGKDGIVEEIGLRSTRLRSLDGTVWCIPNKTMTDSAILNLSVRPNFKYAFVVNLTYDHTTEQLRRGKEMLHRILDNHPLFDMEKQPPMITFSELGDYSLDLQAVCWFQTTNFKEFNLAKEELNFKIIDALEEEGLEMAYPTQSVYIENDNSQTKKEK